MNCINDKRNNCFNLIRIVAACQVLFGHASEHLCMPMSLCVGKIWGVFDGVPIFFLLSGFLIWDSISRTSTFGKFVKKRICRLYPELLGGVLLSTIFILLLYRKPINYLQFTLFLLTQSTLLQFWTPDCLRGYGCGTPNGSLWTICVMAQCYVILWLVYKHLHKKSIQRWVLCICVGLLCNIIIPGIAEKIFPEIIYKLYMQTFVSYIWLFLFGAMLREYFDLIYGYLIKYWYIFFIMLAAVVCFGFDKGRYGTLQGLLLGLVIVGFGYRFPNLNIKLDISYGLYIYHMIVINVMIEFGAVGQWYDMVIAVAASAFLAIISYYTLGAIGRMRKTNLE